MSETMLAGVAASPTAAQRDTASAPVFHGAFVGFVKNALDRSAVQGVLHEPDEGAVEDRG